MMVYGLKDILKGSLGMPSNSGRLRKGEFWAVKDASFDLRKGESLGIIGPNGSGKTTILKMLNGIFLPDDGKIEIFGKVGALIEVGAGFHPLLTGRENIFVNASILGMTKAEIEKKFDEIVEFADIGEFLDTPVKHYSSGMYVRLGFAIAIHCDPDILLIDEVLSVGDVVFRRKCLNKLEELRKKDISIVFISHNLQNVVMICNKILYISYGKVKYYGDKHQAIAAYQKDTALLPKENNKARENEASPLLNVNVLGLVESGEIEIRSIGTFDRYGEEKTCFQIDEYFKAKVKFFAFKKIQNPFFAIWFWNSEGLRCCGGESRFSKEIKVDELEGDGAFEVSMDRIDLVPGKYSLQVAITDQFGSLPYANVIKENLIITSQIPTVDISTMPIFLPKLNWKYGNEDKK
jgi:lipopolysaccharide transport system ATP-binding protein